MKTKVEKQNFYFSLFLIMVSILMLLSNLLENKISHQMYSNIIDVFGVTYAVSAVIFIILVIKRNPN